MKIEPSLKGVTSFLKTNDHLMEEITGTASDAKSTIANLADRVKKSKLASEELVDKINDVPFTVTRDTEIKKRQTRLLEEIEVARQKIYKYRDDPTMQGLFQADLADLYQRLGETYIEESVGKIVTFTQEEVQTLRVLLRRATLDAEARQRLADVLDAAVQLGKLGLRIAIKLAAL
jgi:hypothetical protein